MELIFIGLIVGIIMGLTGAGGALVSIPLFVHILHVSLKEATVLSLVAVMLGTSINLFGSYKKIDFRISLTFIFFGALANGLSMFVKNIVPDMALVILLTLIAGYSLWAIWTKKPNQPRMTTATSTPWYKTTLTGLFLGLLTTLTGLGGGVILVPILMKYFGKSYENALPTSLATIFSISLVSFLLQTSSSTHGLTLIEIIYLGLGSVGAYFFLSKLLNQLTPQVLDRSRKIVFTLVSLYSISSLFMRIF